MVSAVDVRTTLLIFVLLATGVRAGWFYFLFFWSWFQLYRIQHTIVSEVGGALLMLFFGNTIAVLGELLYVYLKIRLCSCSSGGRWVIRGTLLGLLRDGFTCAADAFAVRAFFDLMIFSACFALVWYVLGIDASEGSHTKGCPCAEFCDKLREVFTAFFAINFGKFRNDGCGDGPTQHSLSNIAVLCCAALPIVGWVAYYSFRNLCPARYDALVRCFDPIKSASHEQLKHKLAQIRVGLRKDLNPTRVQAIRLRLHLVGESADELAKEARQAKAETKKLRDALLLEMAGEDARKTNTTAGEDATKTNKMAREDATKTNTTAGEDATKTNTMAGEDATKTKSSPRRALRKVEQLLSNVKNDVVELPRGRKSILHHMFSKDFFEAEKKTDEVLPQEKEAEAEDDLSAKNKRTSTASRVSRHELSLQQSYDEGKDTGARFNSVSESVGATTSRMGSPLANFSRRLSPRTNPRNLGVPTVGATSSRMDSPLANFSRRLSPRTAARRLARNLDVPVREYANKMEDPMNDKKVVV